MAHHKRKRSKNQRAGCLLCKPWKMNGLAQNKPDAESFSDHRRRREADSELEQFQGEPLRLIAYFNLPLAQRKTQQIADQFNAAEELWRSLELKRLRRRELYPDLSPDLQIQFDVLDFAMARSPRGCIGFVVEP